MLLAGRAQVDVRVDEPRQQVAPAALDDLGLAGIERAGLADLGDRAVADVDVEAGVVVRMAVLYELLAGARATAPAPDLEPQPA